MNSSEFRSKALDCSFRHVRDQGSADFVMYFGGVSLLVPGIPEIQPGDLPAVESPCFLEEPPLQVRYDGVDSIPGRLVLGPGPTQGQPHGHGRSTQGPADQALPGHSSPESRGQFLSPARFEF